MHSIRLKVLRKCVPRSMWIIIPFASESSLLVCAQLLRFYLAANNAPLHVLCEEHTTDRSVPRLGQTHSSSRIERTTSKVYIECGGEDVLNSTVEIAWQMIMSGALANLSHKTIHKTMYILSFSFLSVRIYVLSNAMLNAGDNIQICIDPSLSLL